MDFFHNLFWAAVVGWVAEWLFSNVILGIMGAVGITGIGVWETVAFVAFVVLCGYDMLRMRRKANRKNNSDDDNNNNNAASS